MIGTYEDYLAKPKALSVEQMSQLHAQLAAELADPDEDTLELYQYLMNNALQYAQIRAAWTMQTPEERAAADAGRTRCHNAVISSFDALARWLRQQGKEAAWRDALGYEKDDRYNRKVIGDFACYLVFVNGLLAR